MSKRRSGIVPQLPTRSSRRTLVIAFLIIAHRSLLVTSCQAAPAWPGGDWPWRRSLELISDPHKVDADDTVVAEFYAPGLAKADGGDLRIASEDGKFVPSRMLQVGPGDRVRMFFNPLKGQLHYAAYWGNAANLPATANAKLTAGLLIETKPVVVEQMKSIAQMKQTYDAAGAVQTWAVFDRPFMGYNPSGFVGVSISRVTGTLYVPIDGAYQIAVTADDCGGLMLDEADCVFAPGAEQDIRYNKKLTLKKGPHPLEYYHLDTGGDWRFTIGWLQPGGQNVEPMQIDAVGRYTKSKVGPLEQLHKNTVAETVADFSIDSLGECLVDDQSSFRIRLTAAVPNTATNVRVDWDFGDGQTAAGTKVDHIFLAPGTYTIKVSLKTLQGGDTRTEKVVIARDPLRMLNPIVDEPLAQYDLLSTYKTDAMSPADLAMLVRILARGKKVDAMLPALAALCAATNHPNQQWAIDTIQEAIQSAEDTRRDVDLAAALARLPVASNLQPKAAAMAADVLLWRVGDFKAAATMLEPFMNRDSKNLKRLRAEALILDGRPDEAKKIFAALPDDTDAVKRVALSGALARSTEFFIDDHQLDDASEKWDDWQRRFPGSFLEGYSAVLKTRILQGRDPPLAAKVAEAFAKAVPASPYAPQLLDTASKLLAKSDKAHSDALRQLLQSKYPEDPLAQPQK